jgi:hypothetical protein
MKVAAVMEDKVVYGLSGGKTWEVKIERIDEGKFRFVREGLDPTLAAEISSDEHGTEKRIWFECREKISMYQEMREDRTFKNMCALALPLTRTGSQWVVSVRIDRSIMWIDIICGGSRVDTLRANMIPEIKEENIRLQYVGGWVYVVCEGIDTGTPFGSAVMEIRDGWEGIGGYYFKKVLYVGNGSSVPITPTLEGGAISTEEFYKYEKGE